MDALHFISLLSVTAWDLQKHTAVFGLEFLFFQRKYNGHSGCFFLLLYTVNPWDEYKFHGIALNHSWCRRTKFLADWYLSASKILALNYNCFSRTQILKSASSVLIWEKRSIMKTAFLFIYLYIFFFFFNGKNFSEIISHILFNCKLFALSLLLVPNIHANKNVTTVSLISYIWDVVYCVCKDSHFMVRQFPHISKQNQRIIVKFEYFFFLAIWNRFTTKSRQ